MTRQIRALSSQGAPLPIVFALATAAALAATPAHAAEGGLQLVPDPARLLFLLVLFVLLVPLLNALLFRPLMNVLEERGARIEGARSRATDLAGRAAALVAKHEDAVRAVRESAQQDRTRAVEEARRAHQATLGEARAAAERQIAATRDDVGAALDAARARLRAEAEPLAREVAERLLGRSLA